MRPKAIPYVVLLGFLWGSTLVVSRFSVGQYDPRTYISLRLLIAASAHLIVYAISGWIIAERPWPRKARLWGRASIFGIFGTAVSMTCIVSSLQYQSSGVTALLLTLGPVVTVVLAQFFLPDEPSELADRTGRCGCRFRCERPSSSGREWVGRVCRG